MKKLSWFHPWPLQWVKQSKKETISMYNYVCLSFLVDQLILEARVEIIQKIVGYF